MTYEVTEEQAARAKELAEQVLDAFNSERYDEALALIDEYITILPDSISLLDVKCKALNALDQHDDILELSKQMIELDHKSPLGFYRKGQALCWLGRYKESQDALEKCLGLVADYKHEEEKPQIIEDVKVLQGNLHYHKGEYSKAIRAFNQAREHDKLSSQIMIDLLEMQACSHEYLEEYGRAIDCWNEYQKAMLCSRQGGTSKGLELVDMAESYIAGCLFMQGEYVKAGQVVDAILDIEPECVDALAVKAKIFNHQGKYEGAHAVAEEILRLDNQYSYAYHAKAVVLFHQQKYEEAVASFSKSFEDVSINPARIKRWEEAIKCLEEMITQEEKGSTLDLTASNIKLMIEWRIKSHLAKKACPLLEEK